MEILRNAKVPYGDESLGEPFATLDAPRHWKATSWRYSKRFQSWDRPFMLELRISRFPDEKGPRIIADTGEAFSWFDRATMAEQMGLAADPFAGGFGGGLLGGLLGFGGLGMGMGVPAGMPSPSTMLVSVPHTGRPEQRFASSSAYLDSLMIEMNDGEGFLESGRIWFIGEWVVGETPDQMARREAELTAKKESFWSTLGVSGADMRLVSMLDRTVMRHWRLVDGQNQICHLLIGAHLTGRDIMCFKEGTAPRSLANAYPFGQAPRGNAMYHHVDWMADKRVYGILVEGDFDVAEFRQATEAVLASIKFSPKMMGEMEKEKERLSKLDREERAKENAELHRLNQQMDERMRQRDIERAERMRRHEEQLAADRERRRAQDRKMEADRRVRQAWGEAIRGTERYRDPYGHMVEVPVTGPNQRAYYDHMTGRTVMSDVTSLDKPLEWEELPHWRP